MRYVSFGIRNNQKIDVKNGFCKSIPYRMHKFYIILKIGLVFVLKSLLELK